MDVQTKVAAAAKPRVVSVSNMVSKRCSMRTDSAPRQDHGTCPTVMKYGLSLRTTCLKQGGCHDTVPVPQVSVQYRYLGYRYQGIHVLRPS